jgi:penicillin-binding protein 2
VTEDQVKKMPDYMRGDYIGMTALEKYYEKEMRGKPGIKYVLRDNLGRQQGRYENGERDSAAVSGKDLLTSVDLDLQKLGESFMRNKRGAIVAVDPSTGEILALVSGPSYDPNALSVSNRSRNRNLLAFYQDPNKPLINHALNAKYPPGSTFKTGMAALEIQLGWDPNRSVGCGGGYRLSARKIVKCHRHTGTGNIAGAVQHSCNTYFCSSFYHTLNSFPTVSAGLDTVDNYLRDYGFGRKVGIDLSGESIGNLPSPKLYNKAYHEGGWNANTIISMGIGQGEVLVTPVQMVNLAQTIANRGWYYVPHVVKGFRFNGKTLPTDKKFTTKHKMRLNPQNFDWVVEGMNNMAKNNKNVFVPDLDICGKTGTAQNPHGKDNSAFISFAPRNNPRIAVAVYVENAGFGAQFAAPIASMMIEQYLNGTVKRDALMKKMRSTSLVKTFVPDTSRMQPIIQINTTLLPKKDTAKRTTPTVISPAPINNNAPVAPTQQPPVAPTATLPQQAPATKPSEPQN